MSYRNIGPPPAPLFPFWAPNYIWRNELRVISTSCLYSLDTTSNAFPLNQLKGIEQNIKFSIIHPLLPQTLIAEVEKRSSWSLRKTYSERDATTTDFRWRISDERGKACMHDTFTFLKLPHKIFCLLPPNIRHWTQKMSIKGCCPIIGAKGAPRAVLMNSGCEQPIVLHIVVSQPLISESGTSIIQYF